MLGYAAFLGLAFAVLGLPGIMKRGRRRRAVPDENATIADAVRACRRARLSGWDLVAHAQRIVARRFAIYSLRNPWDSPARAFARGMGYCVQYNLALKEILDQLGFATRAVHAFRVRDLDNPTWTMGHAWLRVRWREEERDVCAGHEDNTPGRMRVLPLTRVRGLTLPMTALACAGSALIAGVAEWRGVLTGSEPGWTFRPRQRRELPSPTRVSQRCPPATGSDFGPGIVSSGGRPAETSSRP